jgi:AAA+ ATPase superfamily predicted ATPase
MSKVENPFLLAGYHTPNYFCDRTTETKKLVDAIVNGRNIILLSARRLGKTGLIKNAFYHLKKKKGWRVLYVDIMPTNNLSDFIKLFTTAVVELEQQSKNYMQKIAQLLSVIRAKLTINYITGAPEIEVDYATRQEAEKSLSQVFYYLSQQNVKFVVAFDEFQQIVDYPEKNTEALLRSHIQHLNNVNFIFSGSNKRLLTSMFADHARPFYQSSDFLHLEKLDVNIYSRFIHEKFAEYGKTIALSLVKELVEYYQVHTFYVQYFFNKLFGNSGKKVKQEDAAYTRSLILDERDYIYYGYRNLLTSYQFSLLKAIARENGVSQPNAAEFIAKHNLKQGSSVNRALAALVDKQLVFVENDTYYVYDVFFAKWLSKLM